MPDRSFLYKEVFKKRAICAEIGVFMGSMSSQIIIQSNPKMLHLIDPWIWRPGWIKHGLKNQEAVDKLYENIRAKFSKKKVKVHRGLSEHVVSEFSNEYFDWVYIDGRHSYDGVLQDLTLYYPKVKPGGLIVGDDYNIKMTDRVKRAVKEFTSSKNIEFKTKNNQYWFEKSN